MRKSKKIAATLLGILCAGCVAGGLTACKAKGPTGTPDNATTYRLALPNDGSAPTAHTGLENIGYMAYALDRQEYYHAYAHGVSTVMGFSQTTQTWKDYKDKIMICSDLTYSAFVRAGTQACFVNNEVYMRSSETPGASTTSTTANWKTSKPTHYDRDKYLTTYGEFSTEISVYIINEETINSWGEVVENSDGTYSQSFSLNQGAAYYYQYGMKTRGDLKGYPEFKSINITFTFDKNWTVLKSHCEEKTSIAPSALGGMPNESNSTVNTTFDYSEEGFNDTHYGYYESYYKQYIGKVDDGETETHEPIITEVLASAFGGVITGGEQFNAELKLGQTGYDGKLFLSLSLDDLLGSIDARLALGQKGSGKQDLYVDFAKGAVNAYYSDEFAMTLNVDALSTIISQFSEWASRFNGGAAAVSYAVTEGEEPLSDGLDLASLMDMLKLEYDDSTVTVSVETDDLLGTGIGVRLYLYCDRGEENTYIFKSAELESIAYDKTSIDLSIKLTPDKNGTTISHNKAETPANLADYAKGIYSMLNCDTLKVSLGIDGTKQKVTEILKGLNVNADAYVELGYNLATRVDFNIEYEGVTAELSAYYGNNIDFKSAGKIFLDLKKVNGEEIGAKIYCDIDQTTEAVKEMLALINGNVAAAASLTAEQSEQAANSVATMINGILNLNFGEVLGDLYASNSQIRVNADVDAIINALGVNVNGIKFGTAALALNLDNDKSNLALALDNLGLTMNVEGSGEQITIPEKADYFDAIQLVELVKVAVKESNNIITEKAIAFNIDAYVLIDGVPMQVVGRGEVKWANGIQVAINATMNIANGVSADAKDEVELNLFYDTTAEGDNPFIRFAVNNLGMEIYSKNISDTQDLLQNIIDSINQLMNGEKSGNASVADAAQLYNSSVNLDGENLGGEVAEVVESYNLQQILGVVFGFVKDLTVSTDYNLTDGSVSKLIIEHALCGNITLAANGGLSLDADITNTNGTQICIVKAGVSVGNGSAFEEVNTLLDGIEMHSTKDTAYAFLKIAYDYLFAVVENQLSVANTLGSDTYEVKVELDGNKSGIPALKDVNVTANLYYTQGLVGDKKTGDKLAEIDLDLTIGATTAKANVRYCNEKIYISLDKLNGTELGQVKFYADKDEIYSAVEELVKLITDENVVETLTNLIHPTEGTAPAENGVATQADSGAVTEVVNKVLTLNFADIIKLHKVNGDNTVTVNVDSLLELLGANTGFAIGTAEIGINPKTHAISGNVSLGGHNWVTLSAAAAEKHEEYKTDWQGDYTDIGFISTFIGDLAKTAVTNGELNTLYTLSGDISVKLSYSIVNVTIDIKKVIVTAGLDENKNFYLTLTGELQSSIASSKSNIAITYSNGYITMGRDVSPSGGNFKVMTLDYLLANLLSKNNSPIQWLLGTDEKEWGLIATAVGGRDLGPDLNPQEYTVYQQNIAEPEPDPTPAESSKFNLSDILAGMMVVLGDKEITFGETKSILAVKGDYYGFDLNLSKFISGETLSNVYLTLCRDNNGLTGLKLKTTAVEYITLTVNLDNGINEAEAQPDYFKQVTSEHNINFDYRATGVQYTSIFGCYSTQDRSYGYTAILSNVSLTVLGADGYEVESVSLKYGSSIYVIEGEQWNEEHTQKLIYIDQYGNNVTATEFANGSYGFYLTYNAEIKPVYVGESAYNFHTENGDYSIDLYVGDILPESTVAVDGKTFAGWYLESECVNYVTSAQMGVNDYYAKYVTSTVTEANGVTYQFVRDASTTTGGYYTATAFDNSIADKDYTESGNILVIPDYVNGYPVTRIGFGAFQNKGIKNVVVGANITYVEAQAFMDNKDMESAVFLADIIYFGGSSYKSDGKRFVFLGCGKSTNDSESDLKVYYNNLDTSVDDNWAGFKNKGGLSLSEPGNGINLVFRTNLFPNGSWAYVILESDNFVYSLEELGLNNFISITEDGGLAGVIADAQAKLNALMLSDGADYINAYKINITGDYSLNGAVVMHVSFVESEKMYELDASATLDGESKDITVLGVTEFNGAFYAAAGTEIEIRPVAGLQFTGVQVDENGYYVFEMPAGKHTLRLEYENMTITEVTLVSAVDYTYGGTLFTAEGEKKVVEISEGVTLETPYAADYIFLGWAYDCDGKGSLIFTEPVFTTETVKAQVYYAIWGVARDEISSITALTSGTDPNAAAVAHNGGLAAGFEGWYTDSDFIKKVEAISTSTTVLSARMNFTLTVTVNGTYTGTSNYTKAVVIAKIGDSEEKTTASSAGKNTVTADNTQKFTVLEGETLTVKISANNKDSWIYRDSVDDLTNQIGVKGGSSLSTSALVLSAITVNGTSLSMTGEDDISYIKVDGNYNVVYSN